jgi:hypothetical protein
MDLVRRENLGYAFINFTNAVRASIFWKAFNKYKWNVVSNHKICEASLATIQVKGKSLPHVWHSDQINIYRSQ